VHDPRRLGRTLAQGDGEHAAGTQQAKQLARRAGAFGWHDVLPHCAEQDQIEGKPETKRCGQGRQAIGDPAHARAAVVMRGFGPQAGGGLDGNDIVAQPGEPGRVAPATGADIQNQGRRGWQQPGQPAVQPDRVDGFVSRRLRAGVRIVPGHGIGDGGHVRRSIAV